MFASRANKENAAYEQQTAAAAKPLNQGVKGLAPKTPGAKAPPKTPFKVPLNDENAAFGGKTGGKGGLFGDGKTGKVDKSSFVTPAGPKTRAPLGNKTTNAKAAHFQTPVAPQTQEKPSAKHTSPRLRRAKIKVHEAEPETAEHGSEEPDIEYMPPREVPLPDHPDDCWPVDRTYPQFEGKNLTRGWWSEYSNQADEDEDTEFSDFEEKLKAVEQKERSGGTQGGKKGTPVKKAGLQTAKRDPLTTKAPQTMKAKSAATALSGTSKPSTTANLAAPKARSTSTLASKKPALAPAPPGNTRHTAAKVASNSTLGYSKGRAVSGAARKPLAQLQGKQVSAPTTKPRSASPQKKKLGAAALDELFGMPSMDVASDEDDGLGGKKKSVDAGEEEEDEDEVAFQLDAVQL